MFKKKFIFWPAPFWDKWFIYDVLSVKKYSIDIKQMSKDEQIAFFWGRDRKRLVSDSSCWEAEQLFKLFEKKEFIDDKQEFKTFKLIDNSKKRQDKSIEVLYDRSISREFRNSLSKLLEDDYKDEAKQTIKFYIAPIFNSQKLTTILEKNKSIVPISLSESDLIVGPMLTEGVCPCIDCIHIRLGASSFSPKEFERFIYLDNNYFQFLNDNNIFDVNYSNIDELLSILIRRYVEQFTLNRRNFYIRYNLFEEKIYENDFLEIPHYDSLKKNSMWSKDE